MKSGQNKYAKNVYLNIHLHSKNKMKKKTQKLERLYVDIKLLLWINQNLTIYSLNYKQKT